MDGRTATYVVTCLRAGMEDTCMYCSETDGRTDRYLRGDMLERRNEKHVVLRRTDLHGDVLEGRNGKHLVLRRMDRRTDGRTYMVM